MLARSRRQRKDRHAPLHFASSLPHRPLPASCAPITAHPATGRKETATMGFTLDSSTIRELAAAIAAGVVQAMRAARISTVVSDDREVVHVGPLTVDLGRREAALHGRALNLKPRELSLLAALARNAGR